MEKEILTQKEKLAQESFMRKIKVIKRKTKKPIIVAMVGLVGSGKSSVAKELAKLIGATIINGDAIRICLRKVGERYEGVRKIGENAVEKVIEKGGNAVLDSDFGSAEKKRNIEKIAKKVGVRMVFIRTHANYDIMAGRAISAKYFSNADDFFGGASTKWQGNEKIRGAVVKLREMWRRTPHHYQWDAKAVGGGGMWVLKKLPFPFFAIIDTAEPKKWKNEVIKIARRLRG